MNDNMGERALALALPLECGPYLMQSMSRSKHTDPRSIRAARRVRAPHERRGVGDLHRRRELGWSRKEEGVAVAEVLRAQNRQMRLRIIMRKPGAGFLHPASKKDILEMLDAVGPVALYGLRSVELARSPANGSISAPVFGRYCAPGRLILFEQPMPPWRLPGLLRGDVAYRLERAGAVVTRLAEVGATLVDWPSDTLRRFMLEEVLLHELGNHVLQHDKGKRSERIARTRDHEAFAVRFADKHRLALLKGRSH